MAKQTINIGASANDNTGDTIRDGGDKINDNFTELYDAKRFGIYDYNNTITPQSFTGTPIVLQNNGAGADTYKNILTGVADIYDTTNYEFDFSGLTIGDIVTIRINLIITTSGANQNVRVYLELAQGTGNEYEITAKQTFYKTATVHALSDAYTFVYMGNTDTKNNPAKIYFDSDANATVEVVGWACVAQKQTM
jgi:hypothetical protein